MSRITTFADLLQANSYIGRTLNNTYSPLNSVLTTVAGTGQATFIDITSTISAAGYDLNNLSTGGGGSGDYVSTGVYRIFSTSVSTNEAYQYSLIDALYDVMSTSFSTINGEFTQLSSVSTLVNSSDFSTLSSQVRSLCNVTVPRVGHMPVATGAITAGLALSNAPIQFANTIANGWTWCPYVDGFGNSSTIYCSTAGTYEFSVNLNYTTASRNGAIAVQLRTDSGTVLEQAVTQVPPTGATENVGGIRFVTLQSLTDNSYVNFYVSTITSGMNISAQGSSAGSVSAKLVWESNVPAPY
jgi:hypothetical protein